MSRGSHFSGFAKGARGNFDDIKSLCPGGVVRVWLNFRFPYNFPWESWKSWSQKLFYSAFLFLAVAHFFPGGSALFAIQFGSSGMAHRMIIGVPAKCKGDPASMIWIEAPPFIAAIPHQWKHHFSLWKIWSPRKLSGVANQQFSWLGIRHVSCGKAKPKIGLKLKTVSGFFRDGRENCDPESKNIETGCAKSV